MVKVKAAVISLGSKSSKWTAEAMRKYFEEVDELDVRKIDVILSSEKTRVLYDGIDIGHYHCILTKGSFKYASLLRSITEAKSKETYIPLRPGAFTVGHNKLLTHLKLQNSKIPMPKTYVTASIEATKKIIDQMHYPIVMKFPSGSQGKGVMFADSFASASSLLDALEVLKQPLIIQEYIETDGTDIRAFVIGDQVVGAYHRKAVQGEKRANIHVGGTGEKVLLDRKLKKIAVDAAKAIGADICGVDILEGPKGPLVIEVNISPGLQGITKATGIDVAAKIASYLYLKTEELQRQVDKNKPNLFSELGLKDKPTNKVRNAIDHIKIRSDKIVLPSFVTKISDFDDDDEVEITAEKGKVIVKYIKK